MATKTEETPPSKDKADSVHLLLAATGSVATIKIPLIIGALARHVPRLSIRVILTASARHFLAGQSDEQPDASSLLSLPGVEAVYIDGGDGSGRDSDGGGKDAEWERPEGPWRRNGEILHISLRRWADVLVIAPLSANTLAKVAGGLSDNLVTSVCRAWDTDGQVDGRRKRIVVAPAMNTAMWRHPVTAKQVRVLEEEWGVPGGWFEVLAPQATKVLACGDMGSGAMMEWSEVVKVIEARLGLGGGGRWTA